MLNHTTDNVLSIKGTTNNTRIGKNRWAIYHSGSGAVVYTARRALSKRSVNETQCNAGGVVLIGANMFVFQACSAAGVKF